jgi:four helix bundle protein
MGSESFRKLDAWQAAVDLAVDIYRATARFPSAEQFALTDQLRRAAVSISSNIAEGRGYGSDAQLRKYLRIANGSLCEVESQLAIAARLGYMSPDEVNDTLTQCDRVAGLIRGLQRYLASPTSKRQSTSGVRRPPSDV